MSNTLFYREIAPPVEISHLVLSFWEFKVEGDGDQPITHEVFPDGCVSLLYRRNSKFNFCGLAANGLKLRTFTAQVLSGDIFWGVRFSPAACAKILRCNPQEIQSGPLNEKRSLSHLTSGLVEELENCRAISEAIEIFEKRLEKLHLVPEDTDAKVFDAIRIIEESGGETKISDVAVQVNLSPRQLERRFKKMSGLSPKQFARVRRIRATAISMIEELKMNWANRAAEMGFADQSHLTHEFVTITGRSPNSFAEKVKQINHSNLVK